MSRDKAESLIRLCRENNITMVTAESCTGGLIGGALTDISGSSDVFWGGFITYANQAKMSALGVSGETLEQNGAVSEPVVSQMLSGALEKSGASLAMAVSGVAGPGGGTPDKPVGTVWIGVSLKGAAPVKEKFLFSGNREEIRNKTVINALEMAEKVILNRSLLDSE